MTITHSCDHVTLTPVTRAASTTHKIKDVQCGIPYQRPFSRSQTRRSRSTKNGNFERGSLAPHGANAIRSTFTRFVIGLASSSWNAKRSHHLLKWLSVKMDDSPVEEDD